MTKLIASIIAAAAFAGAPAFAADRVKADDLTLIERIFTSGATQSDQTTVARNADDAAASGVKAVRARDDHNVPCWHRKRQDRGEFGR